MSRSLARVAIVLASLAIAACTSATAPGSSDCSGGVATGTGQCMSR